MLSILKHGGTLAIEEATHKEFFHYPENPIFSKAVELLLQQGKIKNVDFNFGEKLYTTLKRFQVTDLKVSSSQPIGITKQDKMMMEYITRDCKDFYIKENLCSTNEINEIIRQLELLAEQDDSIMGYTKVFQVSCKKA